MPRYYVNALAQIKVVPNKPIRDYVLSRDISLEDLARWLDWTQAGKRVREKRSYDTRRVMRVLGISKTYSNGVWRKQETMKYETAVQFADALGMDYWEAGV